MKFKITTPYGVAEHRTCELTINENSVIRRLMVPKGLRDAAFKSLERELPLQRFKNINPYTLCPHHHGIVSISVSTKKIEGDLALATDILALLCTAEVKFPQQHTTTPSVLFKSHTMKGYCGYCRKQHERTEYSVIARTIRNNFPIQRVYSWDPNSQTPANSNHNCDPNSNLTEEQQP